VSLVCRFARIIGRAETPAWVPGLLPGECKKSLKGGRNMKGNLALSKLPGIAFATIVATGMTIAICLGESRYLRVETTKTADELNQQYGVTPAQARAMLAGVLLGWRSSLTNPDLYGPNGELLADAEAPAAGRQPSDSSA
jgi:hypothetical protein